MISFSYKKQSNERLRILWDAYVCTHCEKAREALLPEVYQFCVNHVLSNFKLDRERCFDVISDLFEVIVNFLDTSNYVPKNSKLTWGYLKKVCRLQTRAIVYNDNNSDRQIFREHVEGQAVQALGTYGHSSSTMIRLILEEQEKDIEELFLDTLRFFGREGRASYAIFKAITEDEEYSLNTVSEVYDIALCKIQFIENYVKVRVRSLLYQYRESYRSSHIHKLHSLAYPEVERSSVIGIDFSDGDIG